MVDLLSMGLLTVLGLILIVVGVLGLFTIIHLSVPISIVIVVAGLICIVFGSGRFNLR
jgi:hypothetical protein